MSNDCVVDVSCDESCVCKIPSSNPTSSFGLGKIIMSVCITEVSVGDSLTGATEVDTDLDADVCVTVVMGAMVT